MDTKLAGKKGGLTTKALYGRAHFSKIGGYHPRIKTAWAKTIVAKKIVNNKKSK